MIAIDMNDVPTESAGGEPSCGRWSQMGYVCNCLAGHDGLHAGWTGDSDRPFGGLVAVWDDEACTQVQVAEVDPESFHGGRVSNSAEHVS